MILYHEKLPYTAFDSRFFVLVAAIIFLAILFILFSSMLVKT